MCLYTDVRAVIFDKVVILSLLLTGLLLTACYSTPDTPILPSDTAPPSPTEEILPTATESPINTSIVKFPDGSEITLFAGSQIDVFTTFDLAPRGSGGLISLQKGQIIVNSNLPTGLWFTVFNPFNYIALVTGSIMELAFDPDTGIYIMDCKDGSCQMGINIDNSMYILEKQQACMDASGNVYGPFEDVPFDELADLCLEYILLGTPTPLGEQPSATPDIRASATAACQEFEGEFPGTPCP